MDLSWIEQWLNLDLNETSLRWTFAWLVALGATIWNLWDAYLDLRAVYASGKDGRIRTSAWWFFRQDAVKTAACLLMVVAGVCAIVRFTGPWIIDMLTLAGFLFAGNQVWNRIDRWKVTASIKRVTKRESGRN